MLCNKIFKFIALTVLVFFLIQWAPAPIQNNVEASISRGDCNIEMGSRRGWITGRCKGSTEDYCSIDGDCEDIIEILEE